MEVSLITIICIKGYMPQMNAQMCSLIGVIKIYFVAQKSKKKNAAGNELIFNY